MLLGRQAAAGWVQVALALTFVLYETQKAAAQPAAAPTPAISVNASGLAPCEPAVIGISQAQLVNLDERTCLNTADGSGVGFLLYSRAKPFGFSWPDPLPGNCSIQSVQAMVLPGISCTGTAINGGGVTFNGQQLPQRYIFPYDSLGRNSCACGPPRTPPQVLSMPVDDYSRGRNNTLSILLESGINGLAALTAANVTGDRTIYAAIAINAWTQPALLPTARASFGYVTTLNATVLAVGGVAANGSLLSSVDEYNSSTGTWAPTANGISAPVSGSKTALLSSLPESDGRSYLLNAGGTDASNSTVANTDVFDTRTRSWQAAMPMNSSRALFQLTSILDDSNAALASGGVSGSNGSWTVLDTCELYDVDQTLWVKRDALATARYRHRTSRLATDDNPNVLVTGGIGADGQALASAEILGDATDDADTWQDAGSMAEARYDHTSQPLANGSVLICGGAYIAANGTEVALRSCELFTNGTGWSTMRSLTYARAGHRAIVNQDGSVLIAGGRNGQAAVQIAELWNCNTGNWIPIGNLPAAPLQLGLASLPNNQALAFGGGGGGSGDALFNAPVNGTNGVALFTQAFNLPSSAGAPAPAPGGQPGGAASSTAANDTPAVLATPPPSDFPPNGTYNINLASDSGFGTGAIIGVVIGGVVLLIAVLVIVFTYLLLRRRRQTRSHARAPDPKLNGANGRLGMGHPQMAGQNGHAAGRDAARGSGPQSLADSLAVFLRLKKPDDHAPPPLPAPPAQGLSVELRKAQASPFDSSGLTAKPVSVAGPAGVVLPSAIASPFDSLTGNHGASPGHTGPQSRVLSPATSGMSCPATQNTGVSRASGRTSGEDPFDSDSALSRPSRAGSKHMGIQSVESARSDLSRVSMTIQNELHAAEWRIERGSLTLGKRLGKGGFGEVFEGRHHGSAVAVKVLEIADDRTMLDACHEFGFLHGLRHSKLVISYGACVDGNNLLLVMERMEEDLFHAIASDQTMAGDSVLWYFRGWKIAVDVASSLVFLHSKGMIHLDVKSLNILLRGKRAEAKLGDLGLARLVPEGALFLQNTLPGTPAYSAPEVMQAQLQWRLRTQGRKDQFRTEVGTPADIFAFGVVLFEICTGCHPARWRQEFTGELRPEQGPPAIAKLIDDCLSDDPLLRPSAAQVLDILLENKPPSAQE